MRVPPILVRQGPESVCTLGLFSQRCEFLHPYAEDKRRTRSPQPELAGYLRRRMIDCSCSTQRLAYMNQTASVHVQDQLPRKINYRVSQYLRNGKETIHIQYAPVTRRRVKKKQDERTRHGQHRPRYLPDRLPD